MRWSSTQMDRLERAARDGKRVAVMRRGTEYIVIPMSVTQVDGRDAFIGHLPMTGEALTFVLDDLDDFQIVSGSG